ncbi:MAG: hypothetical protein CMF25_03580 [Kangiellaceae bacterium]|nr:hypothetical protein [Kangiellaceae bacterium]|tara:strand:- start:1305 stop:1754 length:450 start_codon:yes stop_codon:yes gene_type:complete
MIRYFFRKFFQPIDTVVAFAASTLITWLLLHFKLFTELSTDLVQTMIESLIGLLGLIMAFMAIIFSFNDSEKLQYFKKTESFATVMDIIVSAIVWISLSVVTLISINLLNIQIPAKFELGIFIGVCTIVIVKTGRCVWITKKLFDLSVK